MDSRFVRSNGLLVLYITDFHFAILLILDFELISLVKGFQFVSLRSSRKLQVALATNQREKNKNQMMTIRNLGQAWLVTEVVHPSIQNFRN